jgi:uncharacterized protein with GYD domain
VPTFITLANFTDQGIRNIREMPGRLAAFKSLASQLGVTVQSVYYTTGSHDVVLTLEGAEMAVTSLLVKLGSLGNVRTETLSALSPDEMKAIVSGLP